MLTPRLDDLMRFYSILAKLEQRNGGARKLANCVGRMPWPQRGVYFFREDGENRSETGSGPRIVRVGTHALKVGGTTTLWTRLSQHRGQLSTGGGNHRGSIFRLIVGGALIGRDAFSCPSWGDGNTAPSTVRTSERELEQEVSRVIGAMTLIWLSVDDEPGPESARGTIERNSIALLSNLGRSPIDPASKDWLGHYSDRGLVKDSGLWNQRHVDDPYEPGFLDLLDQLAEKM